MSGSEVLYLSTPAQALQQRAHEAEEMRLQASWLLWELTRIAATFIQHDEQETF